MKEQVVTFGSTDRLTGVLTEPEGARKGPHLILLNAGFVHRVGPGRLYVELSRHLGESGFASLRCDLSGIGDSAPRVPPLDPISCGIVDVKEAMDRLSSAHGAREFVLLGLCSGARHAHHVAVADSRVVGAIMLDGYCFPSTRSKAMAVRDRLDHPLLLLMGAKRRAMSMLSSKHPAVVHDDEGDAFFPQQPTRAQMASDLRALAARSVRLLSINSAEWQVYHYAGQLRDAFREVELERVLTERRIEEADHMYFTRPERDALLAMVTTWMLERFS